LIAEAQGTAPAVRDGALPRYEFASHPAAAKGNVAMIPHNAVTLDRRMAAGALRPQWIDAERHGKLPQRRKFHPGGAPTS
jgi:hypothetical protein